MRKRVRSSGAKRAAIAVFALGLATAGWAAPPASDGEESVRNVPVAGMQVAIDAQTGRLRQPTPAEARQLMQGLQQMLRTSAQAEKAVEHGDGTLSLVLGGEHLNVYMARLRTDGGVALACVDSLPAGQQFLVGGGSRLEEK